MDLVGKRGCQDGEHVGAEVSGPLRMALGHILESERSDGRRLLFAAPAITLIRSGRRPLALAHHRHAAAVGLDAVDVDLV